VSFNEAEDTQKDNANATTVLDTGGWYAFAGFGSFVTVSSDTTVAFALKGGFPV